MTSPSAGDLSGGIDPAREFVFATRPDNPEMRDSVSFWVFDDGGEVGLPRIGIEAVASSWESHSVQVNVAFGDGTVYRLRDDAPSRPVEGATGKPTVLGAGPLAFECVAPFDVWTMTFDGQAVQTSSAELAAGRKDGPLVDLRGQLRRQFKRSIRMMFAPAGPHRIDEDRRPDPLATLPASLTRQRRQDGQ